MAKKLYVGNLSYQVTSDQLNGLFAQYGVVNSAEVLTDRFSGRSKGFGFVEMENDQEADAAIAALHDQDFEGRKLVVNVARPKTDRPAGDFGPRRSNFNDHRGGGR